MGKKLYIYTYILNVYLRFSSLQNICGLIINVSSFLQF